MKMHSQLVGASRKKFTKWAAVSKEANSKIEAPALKAKMSNHHSTRACQMKAYQEESSNQRSRLCMSEEIIYLSSSNRGVWLVICNHVFMTMSALSRLMSLNCDFWPKNDMYLSSMCGDHMKECDESNHFNGSGTSSSRNGGGVSVMARNLSKYGKLNKYQNNISSIISGDTA